MCTCVHFGLCSHGYTGIMARNIGRVNLAVNISMKLTTSPRRSDRVASTVLLQTGLFGADLQRQSLARSYLKDYQPTNTCPIIGSGIIGRV